MRAPGAAGCTRKGFFVIHNVCGVTLLLAPRGPGGALGAGRMLAPEGALDAAVRDPTPALHTPSLSGSQPDSVEENPGSDVLLDGDAIDAKTPPADLPVARPVPASAPSPVQSRSSAQVWEAEMRLLDQMADSPEVAPMQSRVEKGALLADPRTAALAALVRHASNKKAATVEVPREVESEVEQPRASEVPPEKTAAVTEVHGLPLLLDPKNPTGYKGVAHTAGVSRAIKPYTASVMQASGVAIQLGFFRTAVQASVCYSLYEVQLGFYGDEGRPSPATPDLGERAGLAWWSAAKTNDRLGAGAAACGWKVYEPSNGSGARMQMLTRHAHAHAHATECSTCTCTTR